MAPDGLVFANWDGSTRLPNGLTKEFADAMGARRSGARHAAHAAPHSRVAAHHLWDGHPDRQPPARSQLGRDHIDGLRSFAEPRGSSGGYHASDVCRGRDLQRVNGLWLSR
jgi:hypothetical protein